MPLRLTLTAAAMALVAGAAAAQGQAPVIGKVKSVSPGHVVITTATGDVDLPVTSHTRVAARRDASPDDIKVGAYLGTANVTTSDGGVANEVHLMASGPNVANTPMAQPNQVMTNGHVKSVKTTAKGQEVDIDYGGADTRHVIVPANIPMTYLVDAALTPGASVIARTIAGADGNPVTNLIQVTSSK